MTKTVDIEEAVVAAVQEALSQCEYDTECLEAMATVLEGTSTRLRAFVAISVKGAKAFGESDR